MRKVMLIGLLFLAACGDTTPRWHDETGFRWRQLEVSGRGEPGFRQVDPEHAGIQFVNRVSDSTRLDNRILAEGAGVAIGDVDGDGLADLFFAAVEGPSALYRNAGGWEFEDITASSGLALPELPVRGAVLVDVDGDVDLDLVVSIHAERNRILLNDGSGRFAEPAEGGLLEGPAGPPPAWGSTTIALADTDGDEDLDLYIANYKRKSAPDLFDPGSLTNLIERAGDTYRIREGFRDHFRVVMDGGTARWWEYAEPDEFYRNDGSGAFVHEGLTGGSFSDSIGVLTEDPRDWGLAAAFRDWDRDGDPDLYVANDFNSPDRIWVNRGDGTFEPIAPLAIRTTSLSSMAVAFGDVDRDGATDFVTTDMLSRTPARRRAQRPSVEPSPVAPGDIEVRPQVNRNTLQIARGDGTFSEQGFEAGLAASDWTWGALFTDVDLDGYPDLLVTTGHPWDQLDADTHDRLADMARDDWRSQLALFPSLEQPNAAFRNRGDGTFEDVSEAWGFSAGPDVSHGIAAGDLDGDGDLDLVVTRLDRPPLLLRNETDGPRVAVRLRGRHPNTGGIGAHIQVRGDGIPTQSDEVMAGGAYLSGSEALISFAAGTGALELTVHWPDGGRTRLENVRPDRLYEIEQPAGDGAGRTSGSPPSAAQPIFADLTGRLGHTHAERAVDDFARQPGLPNKLSQLGPGVSWEDIDRDGDPDLVLPGGTGGSLAIYNNRDGSLEALPGGVRAGADQTTALVLPGPGRPVLLVGQASYEASSPAEALAIPAVLGLPLSGSGRPGPPSAVVPGSRASIGPLALGDVDADGDLDLFVGGRVLPAAYPAPPDSRLFMNQGGALVADEASARVWRTLGMVSAAMFADLDRDGAPELLAATEWGPVRVFTRVPSGWRERTAELGLDRLTGRWNGLSAGDFNQDGRPDLVLTGWGDNTVYAMAPLPVRMTFGDFDGNGIVDPVESQRDPDSGAWLPLADRATLLRGIRGLDRGVPDYRSFARSDLPALLGGVSGLELEAAELRHHVLLSGPSGYTARPLPPRAQVAPAFGSVVADFDGDGHEDLFIGQNFFPVRNGIPRYDAGRSLLLLGDGAGRFEPVSASHSGIAVYGDPRGAATADFDGDGRADLVVTQNGGRTRLYRNQAATPGIRVRLHGPAGNPDAVGAVVWLDYGDSVGPAREVRAGSGYWSRDGATVVLGAARTPVSVRVRWPGGVETAHEVPPTREVTAVR